MKKNIYFLIIAFFFISVSVVSQQRTCGSAELLEQQLKENPSHSEALTRLEELTQSRANSSASQRVTGNVIFVPVVIHVVYNTDEQNISDEQIQSQINVLNEDFRGLNSEFQNIQDNIWPQAADMEIEFYLAQIDPDGNPTNGITRTQTNVTSFVQNEAMKSSATGGQDPWDTSRYFNFWTVNLSGSLLGFAQFPGGDPSTDGIVMGYNFFGSSDFDINGDFALSAPFDKGRTTTHEIGHFLNLRHIWGDGPCGIDDFVNDTPEAGAANFGCQIGTTSCGSLDMVENYMDFSDDFCMGLFTEGQKNRMRATLEPGGPRASLNQPLCNIMTAADIPINILDNGSSVSSVVNIEDVLVVTDVNVTIGTFTGTFLPEGDLGVFNDEFSDGEWLLTVQDVVAANLGVIEDFSIVVCGTSLLGNEDDLDNDGILNEDDNCPINANADQNDSDGDGIGDRCDDDDDNDGILDVNDNCQFIVNVDQADNDNDGIGDICDDDDDNDGVLDDDDNCQFTANSDQSDVDNDGIGDVCDNITVNDIVTPNGDGINDTWTIQSVERFPGTKVRVYNRLGKEIFKSNSYRNDWAATGEDGNALPTGSYYYVVDQSGEGNLVIRGWLYVTY